LFFPYTCCILIIYTDHLVLLSSCTLSSPAVLIFLLKGYEPGLCALRNRKRISSNNTYIHYPHPCSLHSHHDTRHPLRRRQTTSSSHFTFTTPPSCYTSSSTNLIVDKPHRRQTSSSLQLIIRHITFRTSHHQHSSFRCTPQSTYSTLRIVDNYSFVAPRRQLVVTLTSIAPVIPRPQSLPPSHSESINCDLWSSTEVDTHHSGDVEQ
jgi:hypothetical protein